MKLWHATFVLLASVSASASPPPPSPRAPAPTIDVATSPPGGTFFIDGLATGQDTASVSLPRGSRLTVHCLVLGNSGWNVGRAELKFDGSMSHAVCSMEPRATRCVAELRNPFNPGCGAPPTE